MLKKRWVFKDSVETNDIKFLSDSLNISYTLAKLLVDRGIKNFHDAKAFFRPSLDNLYVPFLMSGMKEATSRVIHAITNNEKITNKSSIY